MSAAFSVCVYCGSRSGAAPEYRAAALATGTWIGQHGSQLVYGGGKSGLMGVVADATLQAGGTAIGIIPTALVEKECAHDACTELHVVATMHERKRMMAERADVFLNSRPRQGERTQCSKVNLRVDAGRLHVLMSQLACDLDQAGAPAQHLAGQCMAKLMYPGVQCLQSGSGNRRADDRAYAGL